MAISSWTVSADHLDRLLGDHLSLLLKHWLIRTWIESGPDLQISVLVYTYVVSGLCGYIMTLTYSREEGRE